MPALLAMILLIAMARAARAMARAARAMEVKVTDMAQAARAMDNLHRATVILATAILLIATLHTVTQPLAIATVLQLSLLIATLHTVTQPLAIATVLQLSTLMAMAMVRVLERTPTKLMATRMTALAIPQAATAIRNTRMPKLPTLMSLATV